MKVFFIVGLLIFVCAVTEELHFLSDYEAEYINGLGKNGTESAIPMIDSIIGLADKAINIFKSSKSTIQKERILKDGYKYFKGKCSIQQTVGLLPTRFDSFIERLMKRLHVPAQDIEAVVSNIQDMLDTD